MRVGRLQLPLARERVGGGHEVKPVGRALVLHYDRVVLPQVDWALCVDELQGWIKIDTAAGGGGGGGGAAYLNDLLDVELQDTFDNELFKYDSTDGMWRNANSVDGGTY